MSGRPTAKQVAGWADELTAVAERIGGRFARSEPRRRATGYVRGLLSSTERKNGWQLAEHLGDPTPDGVQHLLARAEWDADAVRDDLIGYVAGHLGHPGGVLVVDETGFLKKGTKSCGVARQYSGTAGRIENCQVGVFLGYATRRGRVFLDRELYLPKEWAEDDDRRAEAKVPERVRFATKLVLARRMIDRALDAGVPARWVTADAVYGSDYSFRAAVERRGLGYVVGVRTDHSVCVGWRQREVRSLLPEVPATAWHRLSCGDGAKGPRLYDWAVCPTNCPEPRAYARWLLIRRSVIDPGDVAYFACGGPPGTALRELVRVAGTRWAVEDLFELAKGDCGLDEYEVRSWVGWYRYVTLSLLALAVVAVIRARATERPPKRGAAARPVDGAGGAEADPPAGVGPAGLGRAGAGMVRVAEAAPAPGAEVPLPKARSQTPELRNYGCRTSSPGSSPRPRRAKSPPPRHPDPELASLVEAWPTLLDPSRAGILAMVRAAGGSSHSAG